MPLTSADQQTISQVVDLLRPNRRLLFVTGAGLSVDSGMPTYRDRDGLYIRSAEGPRHPVERALSESCWRTGRTWRGSISWNWSRPRGRDLQPGA